MKLIKPSYKILEQEPGIEGVYKQIELAGRTCYKSEDKITADSAKGFVDKMIKSGHGAMLEHGTVYLKMPGGGLLTDLSEHNYQDYRDNHHSFVNVIYEVVKDNIIGISYAYITTNLRVLVENDWLDDLQYLCEPTEYHERRVTVHFVCDRGVSHEFVRHKILCVA